ncbi:unnamed protein product [Caenorhabditis auriculariae]|uniref:Uncharacterized protein n=1 Tax=Caenorhabditis auriculariae TaxID=2777116 RepID=A0A8S1HFM3_9PELO|nr:unnamed protein product [Caenorhabditis auriculariae]
MEAYSNGADFIAHLARATGNGGKTRVIEKAKLESPRFRSKRDCLVMPISRDGVPVARKRAIATIPRLRPTIARPFLLCCISKKPTAVYRSRVRVEWTAQKERQMWPSRLPICPSNRPFDRRPAFFSLYERQKDFHQYPEEKTGKKTPFVSNLNCFLHL